MLYTDLVGAMEDAELIRTAEQLHDSVNNAGCFSSSDVQLLGHSLTELERRGYDVDEETQLCISRQES